MLDSLEEAAADKRIVGIYLKGSNTNPGNGFATLQEVRQALQRFRDTGKAHPGLRYRLGRTRILPQFRRQYHRHQSPGFNGVRRLQLRTGLLWRSIPEIWRWRSSLTGGEI